MFCGLYSIVDKHEVIEVSWEMINKTIIHSSFLNTMVGILGQVGVERLKDILSMLCDALIEVENSCMMEADFVGMKKYYEEISQLILLGFFIKNLS